jgi:CheY-like chemotaxis protein
MPASQSRVLAESQATTSPVSAPLPELVVAPDGCILECGPAAASLLGLTSPAHAEGVHLSLFCRDADRLAEALGATAVAGRLERWDAELVRVDGKPLPAVIDLVASFEEPRSLTEVRVSIRPASAWAPVSSPTRPPVRDEATQLSHELNNLLAIIGGHAECLVGAPADPAAIEAIRRAVTAAAQVSARVRTLGPGREPAGRAVDIDGVLATVQDDLRRTFGHRLSVVVQPSPHPWTVAIDRAVVQHALTALAADAIQAMPHGGTLTVRTMNVEVGARREGSSVGARPGRYVRVEMSYQTAAAAGPLTPRRRDTDDTGLAAIEALRRAGGRMLVDTDGARIASVGLLLPSDGVTVLKPRSATKVQSSGHTVVLVEADPTHRRLMEAVLRGQGHEVLVAPSLGHVLAGVTEIADAVIVTDAVPGDAPEEAAAWIAARPDLRLLGTSDSVARAVALLDDGATVATLARPLAAGRLIEAVHRLFDGATAAATDASAADVLAHLWLKQGDGQPIHPLEAS